jgi:hypothetical protein
VIILLLESGVSIGSMTGQELADAEAAGGRKRLSGQRGLGRRGDSEEGRVVLEL